MSEAVPTILYCVCSPKLVERYAQGMDGGRMERRRDGNTIQSLTSIQANNMTTWPARPVDINDDTEMSSFIMCVLPLLCSEQPRPHGGAATASHAHNHPWKGTTTIPERSKIFSFVSSVAVCFTPPPPTTSSPVSCCWGQWEVGEGGRLAGVGGWEGVRGHM